MLLGLLLLASPPKDLPYLQAPAGKLYAEIVPGGRTILPNGRFLTPKGQRLFTLEDLWHLTVSPDGKRIVGFHDDGFSVFRVEGGKAALEQRVNMRTRPADDFGNRTAPAGAFSPDGKTLAASTGDSGGLVLYDATTWQPKGGVSLTQAGLKDGYLNELLFSKDGKVLYGVDVATQHVVAIDTKDWKASKWVPAGRQPYAAALSGDGKSLFVANIGLFDYSLIPDAEEPGFRKKGLDKPPFGYPSVEAEKGVRAEGRDVPGLGSAHVADAQSVWSYRLSDPLSPEVGSKAKSGILIHSPADGGKAVGGSAPNSLLAHGGELFVSNANNDTISVFDQGSLKLKRSFKLSPHPAVANLRGVIPSGLAISPDGKRLFVCESGLNSVAVLDARGGRVIGRIPTGWFPMKVAYLPGGSLAIATQKGTGRGPRGPKGARVPGDERYGLPDMPGMIDLVKVPNDAQLRRWNQEVLANNGLPVGNARPQPPKTPNPIPYVPGKESDQIKYVVFITKENHTFDGIFGELKGAKGEPEYAEFGMNGWIEEKGKEERLPIMPNHIRLAEQFAISDNFYMEPQASGDGHRWLNGVYPSLWTTRVFYAGWDFRQTAHARGRLASMGSNGSPIPEDYLENGSMWEHLSRAGISFRNYGEGYELPGTQEPFPVSRTGTVYVANHPMPKVLFDNTDFNFPAYNTNIPDIARADWWMQDVERYRRANGGKIPRFMNIAICNDHGDSARPAQGYPYVCSYMADNDLALGRIVEHLSQMPEWRQMAVFVTQDDPGGDNDHIDRHRSFVLALGPWAKKGYVSNDHTSIMSIIRTIYMIFGLGPNNMFDALATPLHDMFTTTPDFRPYRHVPVDRRVFRPEETFDPNDPDMKKRRAMGSTPMDDPRFVEELRKRGGG